MKKVVIIIAEGFEEMEAVAPADILRRANINVTLAGLDAGVITGARQIKIAVDTTIDKIKSEEFDAIILPGGGLGTENLKKDSRVIALLQEFHKKDKIVAAICAAPSVLHKAGITKGKNLTSYPGMDQIFTDSNYKSSKVVVDGKMITSRGPATAIDFSLAIVEMMAGKEMVDKLKTDLVYNG